MKTTVAGSLNRQLTIIIICLAAHYLAPQAMRAQDQAGAGTGAQAPQNSPPAQTQAQSSADAQAATTPALNVINAPARPPIPPPPETPPAAQAGMLQPGSPPSLPQAWRVKALQLFKANSNLDKSSVLAMHMQSAYSGVFETTARTMADSGLSIDSVSFSSGHMLVSRLNENGRPERAIIALKQAAPDSDSSASSGTDVRVFCDSRNHWLTLSQIKGILSQVDSQAESYRQSHSESRSDSRSETHSGSMSDSSQTKTGAGSL